MRAWVVRELGGLPALRLETVAEPAPPGPGEVGLAMTAAALNYPDYLMLDGRYQHRPELPFTPGMEGVGRVTAVGEGVPAALLGRRVVAGARCGLLAERVTLPMAAVREVPGELSDPEAAAFTTGFLTAWVALVVRGRIARGEHLLVLGAGGGMGLAAVALGAVLGARVTAVASSAEKLEAARLAGAHALLRADRESPDLRALADGCDLVFDPVGGSFVAPAIGALRWGGRYLVIGFVGGPPVALPLDRLLLKGAAVCGVRAGEHGRRAPEAGRAAVAAIDALARAGRLRPHVGLVVPFAAADAALAALAEGRVIGKAVVRIGD